jgi:hypothetical protein
MTRQFFWFISYVFISFGRVRNLSLKQNGSCPCNTEKEQDVVWLASFRADLLIGSSRSHASFLFCFEL